MKLLVLAQTPPPVHGQSLAVESMLRQLAGSSEIELHHVNLQLSHSTADIGRWRAGKIVAVFRACLKALAVRRREGPMTLYYIPAPGKRGAVYRDWFVMALCRPFFKQLVLHWHGVGLGEWLHTRAYAPERLLTQLFLGRARLSLVLAPELAADAQVIHPRQLAVVPGGLADPCPDLPLKRTPSAPYEILFLGLGCHEKGLFDVLDAFGILQKTRPGEFRFTATGGFASAADAALFQNKAKPLGDLVQHLGFVDDGTKSALLDRGGCLCFPTYYPHEGQPMVLIEGLAHDLPIITTKWRAIPGMLPHQHVWYVEPQRPDRIAEAVIQARDDGAANGVLRAHYLRNFTPEQNIAALKSALGSLDA
jgi:glycosyltransferase involved in cell wall biosynthesis